MDDDGGAYYASSVTPGRRRSGTRRSPRSASPADALWCALGANRANAERLSAADVRQATGLALAQFPERSNRQLAGQIHYSRSYFATAKDEPRPSSRACTGF